MKNSEKIGTSKMHTATITHITLKQALKEIEELKAELSFVRSLMSAISDEIALLKTDKEKVDQDARTRKPTIPQPKPTR